MTSKTTTKAQKPARKRVPLTGHHQRRLVLPDHLESDKDYVYRWFNDVADRIDRALAAGYEYVSKKLLEGEHVGDPGLHNEENSLDSRVSKRLRDFNIYLMRIPRQWWEEDQEAREIANQSIDNAIFNADEKVDESYGDVKYNPNRSPYPQVPSHR